MRVGVRDHCGAERTATASLILDDGRSEERSDLLRLWAADGIKCTARRKWNMTLAFRPFRGRLLDNAGAARGRRSDQSARRH